MAVQVRETSSLSIASLVFGVLGWTLLPVLGCIVAIAAGHMGRAEVKRHPSRYQGATQAAIGLVLGYAGLLVATLLAIYLLIVIWATNALAWH